MANNSLYQKIVKFGLVDIPNYVFSLDISREHTRNRDRVKKNSSAYPDKDKLINDLGFDHKMEVTRKIFRYGKYVVLGSAFNRFANGHSDGIVPLLLTIPIAFIESYLSNGYKQDQEEKKIKEEIYMEYNRRKGKKQDNPFSSLDDLFNSNPNDNPNDFFNKNIRILIEELLKEAYKTAQQNVGFAPTIMQQKNPYDVLGVPRTATEDEIKRAYRTIAKECHPDLNPGDAEKESRLKEASSAYESLTKPNGRY